MTTRIPMPQRIGLIAGSGALPLLFARTLRENGGPAVVAIAHKEETDPELARWVEDLHWVRLGQFKRILHYLKRQRAEQVVLAGGIRKTRIWRIRPDMLALQVVARLRHMHDDHLLRAVAGEIEAQGFPVRGVTEFVPELLAPAGLLSRIPPTPAQWRDIQFGWWAAKALGQLDIGQGVVVRDRVVAAVEALEGTDALIQRAGCLTRGQGVLVKVAKPQQDQRLDLPAIGPHTMEQMHQARIPVLAVEAGCALLLEPQRTLQLADRFGLALVGTTEAEMRHPTEQADHHGTSSH
jgi:hypothetical protein